MAFFLRSMGTRNWKWQNNIHQAWNFIFEGTMPFPFCKEHCHWKLLKSMGKLLKGHHGQDQGLIFTELLGHKKSYKNKQNYAYQNKVTSQSTMWHELFVTGIKLVVAKQVFFKQYFLSSLKLGPAAMTFVSFQAGYVQVAHVTRNHQKPSAL